MDESSEARAPRACVNCRKQKMKCRVEQGQTCRRCRRAGVQCIFVPRANAAGISKALTSTAHDASGGLHPDLGLHLLRRVQTIERHLGLSEEPEPQPPANGRLTDTLHEDDDDDDDLCFEPLWRSAACLEKCFAGPPNRVLWRRPTLKHLFQTFHQTMPGLHFLPEKQRYTSPYPLLLAAILYCSSVRGDSEAAALAPQYLSVLCKAIAQLTIPDSDIGRRPNDESLLEDFGFQNVLGLVIAGLLAEASLRETGMWISIAYRLILEYYPPQTQESHHDWSKLFLGVQIVDLEHASLHLMSPVIPIEPPIQSLQTSPRDQLYSLSRMMHTGLTHFVGRGLPTIWSCFAAEGAVEKHVSTHPFTPVDAAVLRDWARQLDDWLEKFTRVPLEATEDRRTVYRQYVLHRLVVLSIYLPARGCDLYSNTMTPKEQYELLRSARMTVKLHIDDKTIWSNWDVVMITWAALIVIQGIQGCRGEADDLKSIRAHLATLRDTRETGPCLRTRLAARLENALEDIQTLEQPTAQQEPLLTTSISPHSYDQSWEIFNHASLDQVIIPDWEPVYAMITNGLAPDGVGPW